MPRNVWDFVSVNRDDIVWSAQPVHFIAPVPNNHIDIGFFKSKVISRHGDDFRALLKDGLLDILFANHVELAAMTGTDDLDEGLALLAAQVKTLVVTRSEKGAVAIENGERAEVPAEPVARVVDTTGAGDLFAAGFLHGHVRGESLERRLRLGGIAASEVISHYGARPEADLKALMADRLG